MSRPLIMSFREDAADMCLDGRKTMTRRIKDPGMFLTTSGLLLDESDRVIWRFRDTITIKRSRTGRGVGRVRCTGLRVEPVQDITEEDARREGVDSIDGNYRDGFRAVWSRLYPSGWKSWDANPLVVVVEFEPMEVTR